MDKRILAVLIAAMATGTAYAQSNAPDRRTVQSPQNEGYVVSSERTAIVDSSGHCVRTGSWTPARAAEPCDVVPRASTPPVPVAAAPAMVPPVARIAMLGFFPWATAYCTLAPSSKIRSPYLNFCVFM